ncbi:MAG TPA: PAS domain S-box protein, partial [Pyrinomonadaceae bacterium]|nr:PAS domain S-box protein [Pyrinomonadaceae bacterium]
MARPRQQQQKLIAVSQWVFLSLLILVLAAQSLVFASHLSLRVFTSADGLGSSYVSDVIRDSRDFLWFCTRDGLTRFDGQHFVTYRVGEKDAPPGVEQILESHRSGVYWIETTGGLYRFDPNEETNGLSQEMERAVLHAKLVAPWRGILAEDIDGNIWFGGDNLYRLVDSNEGVSLEKNDVNPPGNTRPLGISSIYQSRDKSIWLLSAIGVIRRFPDGREVVYTIASTTKDGLTSVLEDNEGRIWIGRVSGIYVLLPESLDQLTSTGPFTTRDLDKTASVQTEAPDLVKLPAKPGEIFKYTEHFESITAKFLYRSSDNHIWIANGEGAIEFDGKGFVQHTAKQGFLTGTGPMAEDSGGNLWFGFSTGVMRLDRRGFTTFDQEDGLKDPATLAIGESPTGTLYVADSNYFVGQFDGKKFRSSRPQLPLDAHPIWTSNAVFQDSAGEWWFLSSEKLYRFAATENILSLSGQRPAATYDGHNGLRGDLMFHIFEDSHRNVWISNRVFNQPLQGWSRWNRKSQSFTWFSEDDGYPTSKSVSSFAEEQSGGIWIGFYEGGLAHFQNGRFDMLNDENTPKGAITALHIDKTGKLWVASSLSGLGILDLTAPQLSLTHFTTENGLSSNNVRSLTEDDFGNIYAGTARGVDRISPDPARVKHYSVKDGLAGDFVSVSYKARDGSLWFGTPSGLSRLVPENEPSSKKPPVWINGLRIAGERRSISDLGANNISNLELSSGQNNLQIDFSGIDFNLSQSLRYQYKLEGADADWLQPTELATVSYANISPGSYRFMVRAINADGMVSEQPATVAFTLLPPIWQRWWFVGLAVLMLLGSVYALDRFRVFKTRQVENALAKSEESETRFRTLAETASDAIITIDINSHIVYANEAARKIFGYEPNELVGEKLTYLMPEDLRPRHEEGFGNYVSTGRKNIPWAGVELPGRHKDGHEIPLELSFGEFELQGQRYFTGVARDISERKKAEEDLR